MTMTWQASEILGLQLEWSLASSFPTCHRPSASTCQQDGPMALWALVCPLRCCGRGAQQSEDGVEPRPPLRARTSTTHASAAVDDGACAAVDQRTAANGISLEQHGGIEQHCFMDMLDAPLLALILSRCTLRDLLSARAVSRQWRELADEAALDSFRQHWGLRSIAGRPRSPTGLALLGKGAFVRQRKFSGSDTLSSLAVACDTDVAVLKWTNNLSSEHSLHSREHVYVPVDDTRGQAGELVYCPLAGRQFVVVQFDDSSPEWRQAADPAVAQQLRAQAFAKLAVLLSRSIRVDLQQATFYLRGAGGDVRAAMRLHEQDVRWEREQARARQRS